MKKIVIINGHPNKDSYNYALAFAYRKGAEESGATVENIDIASLDFDPNLSMGYQKKKELEPDLLTAIEKLKRADHIVWVFPMWWYGYPAVMKGFIDRTFLPGIAFEYLKGKSLPKKLFKGKTARVIITADTPRWYNSIFVKNPALNQLRTGTLKFCGITPVQTTYIAPIRNSSHYFRVKWLQKIRNLGLRQC